MTLLWLRELVPIPELCWLLTMSLMHALWQCIVLWILYRAISWPSVLPTLQARFSLAFVTLVLMGALPIANGAWIRTSAQRPESIQKATATFAQTGRLQLVTLAELSVSTKAPVRRW